MDLELFHSISKYPFILNGKFYDSVELVQNKTCVEKCKEKDCLSLSKSPSNLSEYVCSKGYDNLLVRSGDSNIILNGLIYKTNRTVPDGRKKAREEYIIDKKSILLFTNKITEIDNYLRKTINETTEKNFSMFHDFKTSMKIFFICTQDIISKQSGYTFEEKLEGSDDSIKELYHALNLITSQLGMIDVIINPISIKFGNKKTINIYKLFHKISILFKHLADKKNVEIELVNERGAYIKDSNCYESIEFIPLILLDNALKYSVQPSTIKIEISQQFNKAKVKVKNIGPFVKDENAIKIFDKFFRDDSGKQFTKQGIGMGLWIAQQILIEHSSVLTYDKDRGASGDIGLNIFEFEIPTITTAY
jgi:light-regulated signal transduction histidine kinase (bacteriophytochrome)